MRCCVCGCWKKKLKRNRRISFHKIPKNKNLKLLWMKAIGCKFKKSHFVCSNHFSKDDFIRKGDNKKVYLRKDAVPTRNLLGNIEYMSNKDILDEDDSDVELISRDISIVEVLDSQDECEISCDEEAEKRGNQNDEPQKQPEKSLQQEPSQRNENQVGESNISQNQQTENAAISDHETVFRMCFNGEDYFLNLKDSIMQSLKSCLKDKGMNIDFIVDPMYLDISVLLTSTQTNKNDEVQTENKNNEVQTENKNENNDIENEEQEEPDSNVNLCFEIDVTPQKNLDRRLVPSYKRSFQDVLDESNKKQKTDTDVCKRPKTNACFNCLGNHSLKDCLLPRNAQKITRNRKAHASRGDRYHIEEKNRFAHLKPGEISDNLKRALGLRSGQIPPFIYKMRLLGYPPGWLEEAKIPHSGLALFDSQGRKVLESDEEDGEVDVMKYKYDVDKIINFPGYNVDPGPNYVDEYKYHGVPPMLPKFKKEEFIKSLGDENILKGYKRKKLKDLSLSQDSIEVVSEDMEIEDVDTEVVQMMNPPFDVNVVPFIPPPPPVPPPEPSIPPPPPPENETVISCRDSPSLDELEERQKQILEALQNSSILETSIEDIKEQSDDGEIEESSQESEVEIITDLKSSNTKTKSESILANPPSQETVKDTTVSTSITTTTSIATTSQTQPVNSSSTKLIFGTPVLKFTPFDKLPDGNKFSVGVSDVINFENLANSTGKYEQMKKVLQKVRSVTQK